VAVLAGLLAGTLWMAGRALGGSEPTPSASGGRHIVREGETLWGIARGVVGPEGDPRPVVEAIRESSGLGAWSVLTGQTIVLPAP
jgi:hypothetical protein